MPYLERPDGCRLYLELHGEPQAEPIVLLEGMGGSLPGWGRHLQELARDLRVAAYDFRGNGRSETPSGPILMSTLVEDTLGLLDHLGIEAAHLYGQSLGGMVAQELALSHPDRVRSLILAATHPGPRRAVPIRAKTPKERPWESLFSEGFLRSDPRSVEEHQRAARMDPQPEAARRRQWEAVQAFDPWDRLPLLRAPTLVLHGTEDRTIDVGNARLLAGRIPGARLALLEGAGHVYHWERPEESARLIVAFVREIRGGPGR